MLLCVALAGWAATACVLCVLRARSRRRATLLGRAAHELRGATSAMSLALQTMRRQPGGRRLALVLDSEFARLGAGLDDLDAAREGRERLVAVGPQSLDRAVRAAVLGWKPVAAGAGRRVDLRWEAGPVPVEADRGRLAQALGNLVANAVEHGHGPVTLRGRRVGRAVRVEITDGGRSGGERLPGARAASDPAPRPGRGLGLGIARRAVAEAGGTLDVASTEDGTVAAIELPVAEK